MQKYILPATGCISAIFLLLVVSFTCFFGGVRGQLQLYQSNYEDEKVIMLEVLDSLKLTDLVEVRPDSKGRVVVSLNEQISHEEARELKSRVSKAFGDRIAERAIRR